MDPVTIGLIAMGIGGAIKIGSDLFDDTAQRKAALMHKEADLKKSALEETMRRAEGSQTQVLSSTKARMAGTGFDSDSESFTSYLTGMASEFQKQNTFQRKQGMASIDLMHEAADIEGSDTPNWLHAISDLAGTVGGMAGLAG